MPHNWFTVLLTSIAIILVLSIPVWCIYRKKKHNRYLCSLGYVLMWIWLLRFGVGYIPTVLPAVTEPTAAESVVTESVEAGEDTLTFMESAFDSMVHTLQTFSMDEDYTGYTFAGKNYLSDMGYPFLADVYGLVNSFLGVLAPILGGALLLDILAGYFPYMKLRLHFRRDKFVFSALNEKSVSLAEDAAKKDILLLLGISKGGFPRRKPLFVFSDACFDRSSESNSELYARARDLGSICLNMDLIHLDLKGSRSVTYFLADEDSHQNISTLSQLLEGRGSARWPVSSDPNAPTTRIYVFGDSDMDFSLAKQVCATHPDATSKVLVRPIPNLMNTAFNLMYEAPLFLPLLSKQAVPGGQDRHLHVTLLGSGPMARELLKAVYWCGQMSTVRLHITVLCDDAEQMCRKINEDCPELIPSCIEKNKLLQVSPYDAADFNRPYCESLNFETVSAKGLSAYTRELLENTDYHILALDADEENLHIAELLRIQTVRLALESGRTGKPVIAVAVRDHRLGDVVRNLKPGPFEPYMIPFASMRERFSCKQVFLTNFTEAVSTAAMYDKRHQDKDKDDIYNSISSTARCVHAPYKIFDMGLLHSVDLEADIKTRYLTTAPALDQDREDRNAWTEHRRWNAFMRALGFRRPSQAQLDRYFAQTHSMKNLPNKLHPCLVESRVKPCALPTRADFDRTLYDYLDYVSMYAYKLTAEKDKKEKTADGLKKKNYKVHDYRSADAALEAILKPESPTDEKSGSHP